MSNAPIRHRARPLALGVLAPLAAAGVVLPSEIAAVLGVATGAPVPLGVLPPS